MSRDGVRADPAKVAALARWSLPSSLTELRSFLGFTGFYRRFIRDYARIALPLTRLTKTTSPFPALLPPDAVRAFEALKVAVTTAPVLRIPATGADASFVVYTDASYQGVGAVLLQEHAGLLHPVAFESRKLNVHESRYPVHELELLAVVHALTKWRAYLEGCKGFTLITDHQTLRSFLTQKDLSRRQARWAQLLAPFQGYMTLEYRPGPTNHADALSRYPYGDPSNAPSPPSLSVAAASPSPATASSPSPMSTPTRSTRSTPSPPPTAAASSLLTCLATAPASFSLCSALTSSITVKDPWLSELLAGYASDPYYSDPKSRRAPALVKDDNTGLFYHTGRLAVPNVPSLRRRLLYEFHDAPYAGHHGVRKTYAAISTRFWWPRLSDSVRRYVASCPTCQRTKPSSLPAPGLLHPLPVPTRPWTHISMDWITDLPRSTLGDVKYDSILTIVDMFSKQAHFVPTYKTATAHQTAQLLLREVYRLHGIPSVIVSDRDSRFTSELWQSLMRYLGTKLNISTAYHPQTDGQSERTNRTLEQILRAYVHPLHDNWTTYLPLAEAAYNSSVHAATGVTPYFANYGFEPTQPAHLLHTPSSPPLPPPSDADAARIAARMREIHDVVRLELERAKSTMEAIANRTRRDVTFKVGDLVRLAADDLSLSNQPSSKLRDRFVGPFKVSAVVGKQSYRLELPASMSRLHPVFHVSRLLPFTSSDPDEFPDRPTESRPAPSSEADITDPFYELVDEILDHKIGPDPLVPVKKGRRAPKTILFRVTWHPNLSEAEQRRRPAWVPFYKLSRHFSWQCYQYDIGWKHFIQTPAYQAFAEANPSQVPRFLAFYLGGGFVPSERVCACVRCVRREDTA